MVRAKATGVCSASAVTSRPAKARARMEDHILLMTAFYNAEMGEFIQWR